MATDQFSQAANDPQTAKSIFDKPGGEAAKLLGLISPEQQAYVEGVQAKLIAIAIKGGKDAVPKAFLPTFVEDLQAKMTGLDITEDDVKNAAAIRDNIGMKLPDGAPQFGFLLKDLKILKPDTNQKPAGRAGRCTRTRSNRQNRKRRNRANDAAGHVRTYVRRFERGKGRSAR